MKRIRDHGPKGNLPGIDILRDLDHHAHSKIRWPEENLTGEQKEKLNIDYERALND